MAKIFAGLDVGKEFHWVSVVDGEGSELLNRRVDNDQDTIDALITELDDLGEATWAVDIPGGMAALALASLWQRNRRVVYLTGLALDRWRDTYPGESKTDARDARLLAEAARTRRDLAELRPRGEVLAELGVLTSHRRDLVADQTRTITRLRHA